MTPSTPFRIVLASALLAGLAFAAEPPATPVAAKTPTELVSKLGDTSFKVREAASRDLMRLREKSFEALKAGLKSPDAEIALRCKRLLTALRDEILDANLADYRKDPKSVAPEDLPCLARWLAVVGKGEASLESYRGVALAYPDELQALQADPGAADEIYATFAVGLASRPSVNASPTPAELLDLQTFLFLGSQREPVKRFFVNGLSPGVIVLNHNAGNDIESLLSDEKGPQRSLFVAWFDREPNAHTLRRATVIGASAGVVNIVPIAIRNARDKSISGLQRGGMLATLGQLVSPKDVALLGPLLADDSVSRPANGGQGDSGHPEIQVRDIALGLSILWSGADPKKYHFDKLGKGTENRGDVQYAILPGKRDEAGKQWAEWYAGQQKAK